jgi:hypothetical protein
MFLPAGWFASRKKTVRPLVFRRAHRFLRKVAALEGVPQECLPAGRTNW